MANPEHLAKLNEGVDAWNVWRNLNPDILPDLRASEIVDAKLSRGDLRSVDLASARLMDTDLHSALLNGARL